MSENEDECRAVGIDPAEVRRLANRLNRAGRDARRLGLSIFGGSGSGSLRHGSQIVVADLEGHNWDGGDGACLRGADGLMRGES